MPEARVARYPGEPQPTPAPERAPTTATNPITMHIYGLHDSMDSTPATAPADTPDTDPTPQPDHHTHT